ncbi:MAG: redox-regulated ATPase YchF [Acidimicrobiia bacterium]|nr:redox-regulated ATPase YchF [Acidimicrobiia bacterium]MYB25143.1 redox-regulated ATPase YchF [Acidimicrobiia bacterium]MYJ14117.1 redox-regulated ATPase YchF [Acidimicrobiia bacterium]
MQRFGLVGLPNSGKSSLFNALTGGDSPVAPYPFATVGTHLGEARVADERLDGIALMSESAKVTPATVQFSDIGGLAAGAAAGEGLGNRFLGGIREVDALVLVLRAFADEEVDGLEDPLESLLSLELELSLADLDSLQRQIDKKRRQAKGDAALGPEVARMERAAALLDAGTALWRSDLPLGERELLAPHFLLTNKPVLAVVNVDEPGPAGEAEGAVAAVAEAFGGAPALAVCARLEAEVAELPTHERAEMSESFGLGAGALARLVSASYRALGLETFFTTGPKETRAWPFPAGATADRCAGLIHSDFQRGFIRAETIQWADLLEIGSWSAARAAGRLRAEGRGYRVQDGDVLEIRFNV